MGGNKCMRISIQDNIWNRYSIIANDKNRDEAQKIRLKRVCSVVSKSDKSYNDYTVNERKNNSSLCKKNDEGLCTAKNIEQKKAVPVVYDYPTNPFMPIDLIADYKADMTTMRINEEYKKSEKAVLNKIICSKL